MAGALKKDIDQLLRWICGAHQLPKYRRIRVALEGERTVVVEGRVCRALCRADICGVREFEQQYEALRRSGYHWIKLHVAGIRDKTLFITVRLPGYCLNVPYGRESINFSKPCCKEGTAEPDWSFDAHYVLVD